MNTILCPRLYSIKINKIPAVIATERNGISGVLLGFIFSQLKDNSDTLIISCATMERLRLNTSAVVKYLSRCATSTEDELSDRLVSKVFVDSLGGVVVIFDTKALTYAKALPKWSGTYRGLIHYHITGI